MPSTSRRATAKVRRFRDRHHKIDHVIRMVTHYGSVNGAGQAGAVTYFGFLSFFPIMALAFFAVGVLAQVYPELRADIRVEIEHLLPGVIGNGENEIPLSTFENYGSAVGILGLLGLFYSGLGWLSGMREALETMFVLPRKKQPNIVVGKVRDLGALILLGLTLIVSVALSGLVAGFSETVLGWFGVDPQAAMPNAILWVVSHGLAIAASTVLLLTLFTLLAQPHVPRRSLLDGALLGAIGFELLKTLAYFLIAQTKGQPAFQTFGVALILLVWINYFSRLVMYAASYAYTSPAAVRLREAEAAEAAEVTDEAEAEAADSARPEQHGGAEMPAPGQDMGDRVAAPGEDAMSDGVAAPDEEGPRPRAGDDGAAVAEPVGVTATSTTSQPPYTSLSPAHEPDHTTAQRGQRAVAVSAGALAGVMGAAALLVRRRARMSR